MLPQQKASLPGPQMNSHCVIKDPLTKAEAGVLHLVDTGLSQEIAASSL